MSGLEFNNDFDFESLKRDSNNFEKIKVEIDGYKLTKMNDNYYQGRRFEESGFNYYFNNQENNWLATEIPLFPNKFFNLKQNSLRKIYDRLLCNLLEITNNNPHYFNNIDILLKNYKIIINYYFIIRLYGGVEREYKSFDNLENAIEECENLC